MNMRFLRWLTGALLLASSLPFSNLFAQPADTLSILAIRVQFISDGDNTTTGDGTFDLRSSDDPFEIDPPPHDRSYFQDHLIFARNYFSKVSGGNLYIKGDVFPLAQNEAYQLDLQMIDYNPNTTDDEINNGLVRLLRDGLQKADEDPAIDFSNYNTFIVFHAGVGRDIDFGFDETPQDIPSLFITRELIQTQLSTDGISVDDGATLITSGIILPETESQEGLTLGMNGILVANIGSQIGFLDLFDPENGTSGIGRFGLMDAGLFNADGLLPAVPCAWTRIDAGWEIPETIYQAQQEDLEIYHTLSANGPRIYKFPINDHEYFLVENRYASNISLDSIQAVLINERNEFVSMKEALLRDLEAMVTFSDSTGVLLDAVNFDLGLPGGGVAIWHIDEAVIEANRAANRVNADPSHRGVDMEEADGSQDIGAVFDVISGGAGSEIGWPLDLWYADNGTPLFEQDPFGEFSAGSIPNSRSYTNRANSHITLNNFSSRDSVMTFRANFNLLQQNFPLAYDADVYGAARSMKMIDLGSDGSNEIVFSTDNNFLFYLDQSGGVFWLDADAPLFAFASELVHPPAFFATNNNQTGMVVLTRNGDIYGFEIVPGSASTDTLFHFTCPAEITSFPVIEVAGESANSQTLYWGCADGSIYGLNLTAEGAAPEVAIAVEGAVNGLHFNSDGDPIVTTSQGTVIGTDGTAIQSPDPIYLPVGEQGLAVSAAGQFWQLGGSITGSPEDGLYRVDSAPIAASVSVDSPLESYFVAGDNHLIAFNYNLTTRTEFPVKLYTPDRESNLTFSPLLGNMPDAEGNSVTAVIAADPAGMISAFDLDGNLLPDFPLAVGDSIAVSPALLDIDGDGDIELACATVSGTVYVWDFDATVSLGVSQWPQQYADAQNRNRQVTTFEVTDTGSPASLLPAEAVFNWPNPNTEDFTFIRYRLNDPADVSIRIFDLAGDLVKELQGSGHPGTDNEVRWDLTNVQSGIYLARVEAQGSSQNEVRVIRIAVVR